MDVKHSEIDENSKIIIDTRTEVGCDVSRPDLHWYALRTYYTKTRLVKETAAKDGYECFIPVRVIEKMEGLTLQTQEEAVIPSLVFIKTTEAYLERLRTKSTIAVTVCTNPGSRKPAIIPDREMEIFIFVTRTGSRTLEAVDDALAKGDKVKITGGIFKGAEGYIKRVHGTKRLVVKVEGVAAIATTFIPKCFIEKI